ncbi:MAG: flotillin-like FloA family protein [Reichenbachiella sp.]|uniref:flotillin-like FloA family protein n=1 Tax=Reichenbachiella sp. TaxID=2184521 RepID=UPI0032661A61
MPEAIYFLIASVVFFVIFGYFVPVGLWITAQFSDVSISIWELVFMRIRKSPLTDIVNSMITCQKAGVKISLAELETYSLASGDVKELTKALITVKQSNLNITHDELKAAGLAGKNLMSFINERKSDLESGLGDTKRELCRKIFEDLSESQINELSIFVTKL